MGTVLVIQLFDRKSRSPRQKASQRSPSPLAGLLSLPPPPQNLAFQVQRVFLSGLDWVKFALAGEIVDVLP